MGTVSASPFFQTRSERLKLARQRYFEEGVTPVGVVTEAIFESWARCQRLHDEPSGKVVFQPVTASRTHLALQKNHQLRAAWDAELPEMESILGATSCAAMLTDGTGVLIGASCAGRAHEQLMPIATRLGVDLSEEAVGTTAPGVVVRTGQPVSVVGAEHFFDKIRDMQCAAAPIRDCTGRLAGVLDISSELLPFSFDAASVVSYFAGAIESRILLAQSLDHLVIRLQMSPPLLETPMAGLVGVDASGQVAWSNGVAAKLLGLRNADASGSKPKAEEAFGIPWTKLVSLSRGEAISVRPRNGLLMWIRAEMHATDGRQHPVHASNFTVPNEVSPRAASPTLNRAFRDELDPSENRSGGPAPSESVGPDERATDKLDKLAPEPSSLRQSDREIVNRTVRECGGNITQAAKLLRVSRGLIYRRLRGESSLPER